MEVESIYSANNSNILRSAQEEAILNGQAMLQTKTEYHTAVSVVKPRNLVAVHEKLIREAELAGEAFFYAWSVNSKQGKKSVEGKSYQLQKAAATYYGNCVINCRIDRIDNEFIYITAEFVDLENGTTQTRPFVQRRDVTKGGGGYDDARRLEMSIGIGISKAKRNVINDSIPGWITDEAMEIAKRASLNKVKGDIDASRDKAINAFWERYKITKEQLEEKIGLPSTRWTAKDIVELRTMFQSLQNGEALLEDIFPQEKPTPAPTTAAKPNLVVETAKPETVPPPAQEEKPKRQYTKRNSTQNTEPTPEPEPVLENAEELILPDSLPQNVRSIIEMIRSINSPEKLNEFKQKFGTQLQDTNVYTVFDVNDFIQELEKREQKIFRK